MKKIPTALIAGILSTLQLIFTFINAGDTDTIIVFEVNIWLSRLFWGGLAIACFFTHFKKS